MKTKQYKITAIWDLFFGFKDGDEKSVRQDRDERIRFQIRGDSYFNNLATMLDLLRQSKLVSVKEQTEMLGRIRDDLIFLQENFRIVPR
jgi:hypothetical protein